MQSVRLSGFFCGCLNVERMDVQVLGIESDQVDMATSASKMLLKVNVNTEMIQQVFDALPAKATQAFVAEESSWADVLANDSTPPRQPNPLQQAPMGTPLRVSNLPAPAVTPSRSPAAQTLEAAATLTPSRLPRDESGKPVALESDTQHAGPPQPLAFGLEPEPLEPEPEPEQLLGGGGPMAVQKFSADLRKAKDEAKELKAGLAAAEQRATDAQTSSELLHDELEKARTELLKAWEESLGVREATPTKLPAAPSQAAAAVEGEPLFESAGVSQLNKSKEKVFALEAALEAGDAEIRRLEQLLASAQAGGGEPTSIAVKPERREDDQEQAEAGDDARAASAPLGFLRITNLHHKVKGSEIKELFGTFGEIEASEVVRDVPFSTATVQFTDPAAANAALAELNGVELAGAPITITLGLPAAASGLDQLEDLAGLLASSEQEQANQTARTGVSGDAPLPLLRSSSSEVAAVAAEKHRHDVEAQLLRSRLAAAEGEAELAKREAQMLRRQLGILRCQPENDEVATQLESEDRKLEGAKAELSRLQMEASAVEERLKMRRAGLEAASGGGAGADMEDGAPGAEDHGGAGTSGRTGSSVATMEAMAAIELAQERSRNQWLEEELTRLTKTTEKDRSYFEKQLAEFAGESSARLRQQKQSARLERMRSGTYLQRYSIEKGGGGAVSTQRRFIRVSECGTRLLWGKSETDQQLVAVAINGIASIEIGHKTAGWKAVELATPPTSPNGAPPDSTGGAAGGGLGGGGGMELPPEWQCLSFLLKDGTGGASAMLLSADNDVDAALWCVGLRMLLEAAAPVASGGATLSSDDGDSESSGELSPMSNPESAPASLFDLRGRKRSLI